MQFGVRHVDIDVRELKRLIKQLNAATLASVNADSLKVWRPADEHLLDGVGSPGNDEAAKRINKIDFSNPEEIRSLSNGQDIASLGLSEYETLLIEMPGTSS